MSGSGQTLATNTKVREASKNRRVQMPLIFSNSRQPEHVVISEKDIGKLVIDHRVQREEIKPEVNDLIMVIQGGGAILQPITLGKRKDGTLSVLDGQQRLWAHIHCNKPIRADVWPVDSIDEERVAFNALNSRRSVYSNHIVATWPGPSGDFVRKVTTNEKHALWQNTDLGKNRDKPYSATIVMKAVLWFLTGITSSMATHKLMGRLDACFKSDAVSKRANIFLDLLTLLNPPRQRLRIVPALAIARVAHRKWEKEIKYPTSRQVTAIQKINWETALPSGGMKFLPVAETILEQKWKG